MGSIENYRSQLRQSEVNLRGQRDMSSGYTQLSGEIRVNGAGESRATVTFPVKFADKPHLSFGAELTTDDAIVTGFMPWANVVILGWLTEERPPTSRLYIGATLGVVTGGVNHQKMTIHWNLGGVAITSPS